MFPNLFIAFAKSAFSTPHSPFETKVLRFPSFSPRSGVREADPSSSSREEPAVELRETAGGAVQRARPVQPRARHRVALLPQQHRHPEDLRQFPALRGDLEAAGDGPPINGDRRSVLVGVSQLHRHSDHHETTHRAGNHHIRRLSAFLADY